MAKKKDTALPVVSEKARVTAAGEEGISTKRVTPPDLGDFHGTFIETETGEEFQHKEVANDPHDRVHHLKNDLHFHALTHADFKKLFEKK